MDRSWWTRFGFFAGCVIFAGLLLWPTLEEWKVAPAPAWVKNAFSSKIVKGLDIQGGLQLMYEVEVDEAIADRRTLRSEQMIERMCVTFGYCKKDETIAREQVLKTREEKVSTNNRGLENHVFKLVFKNASDAPKLTWDTIKNMGDLREVSRSGKEVVLALTDESIDMLRDNATSQAQETIKNRIDELGIKETSVKKRDEGVVVEVPGDNGKIGRAEFDRIRSIIGKTARLEFKICDDANTFMENMSKELPPGIVKSSESVESGPGNYVTSTFLISRGPQALKTLNDFIETLRTEGLIPDGRQLTVGELDYDRKGKNKLKEGEESWRTYLLFERAELSGDGVDDAFTARDDKTGKPYVSMRFNPEGARLFERITGDNVKKRMAIVLDDKVNSAPNIQQKIAGGNAQITLGGGNKNSNALMQEANDLVVVLNAGALPAPIRPANEQLIEASIGTDAVESVQKGAVFGILLVLIFMAWYYRTAGLVADVMVIFNVFFLMAILAALGGALTLPGIAGIALTVGMAVDANVLINERIREELRLGKSVRSAVEQGFDRAFWSIIDSQLTTFIAGVILYQYGTTEIRGFAVTLMIGIVTSVFTGVFCSRLAFDWIVRGLKVKTLNVG